MIEIEKDDDAAAHAPKPKPSAGMTDAGKAGPASDRQDAKTDDATKDGDRSLSVDEMNSANDE